MKRALALILLLASTAGANCYNLAYVPYAACLGFKPGTFQPAGWVNTQLCVGQKVADPTHFICVYYISWPLNHRYPNDPQLIQVQQEVIDCSLEQNQDAVNLRLLNANYEALFCLPKGSIQ